MKKLTQDDFKNAPEWVKSGAVDSDGRAWGHEVNVDMLVPVPYSNVWHQNCHRTNPPIYIGSSYDTTDWQNSALDRE